MLMQDTEDSDLSLITAVAKGCPRAFRQLCHRYRHRVLSFSRAITRHHDLAEEVANDTLMAIWRSAGNFKGGSEVSTWILGIARNLSLKSLRTAGRERFCTEMPPERSHDPWSADELRDWLGVALAQLNGEQRIAIKLLYGLGHSCREIADQVQCPVNTVKTRIHYGRRRLRELLSHSERWS